MTRLARNTWRQRIRLDPFAWLFALLTLSSTTAAQEDALADDASQWSKAANGRNDIHG